MNENKNDDNKCHNKKGLGTVENEWKGTVGGRTTKRVEKSTRRMDLVALVRVLMYVQALSRESHTSPEGRLARTASNIFIGYEASTFDYIARKWNA
eukprot:scaffold834_cov123-Cylindrotheca_fusiformis.AAC.15